MHKNKESIGTREDTPQLSITTNRRRDRYIGRGMGAKGGGGNERIGDEEKPESNEPMKVKTLSGKGRGPES